MTIPLTFDWLTVAWLKVRLHLWWRSGRGSARRLALLWLVGVCVGCVPITRFEETQSAAEVEMNGRKRAELEIARLQAEKAALAARLEQQGQSLDAREQALSQAELDSTTLGKERQEAQGMVDQLRGELARVGGHLQTVRDEQQKLETALAVEAARGRELSRLSRDLALSFHEQLATGEYTLDVERTAVVLRVPRARLFTGSGLSAEAEPVLKGVSRVLGLHKQVVVRVEDAAAGADPIPTASLLGALGAQGIPRERLLSAVAEGEGANEGPPAQGEAEIAFGFSVP